MTVLQLQILKLLSHNTLHSKVLRHKLKWDRSSPSFYQLMKRMEKSKLIEYSYIRINDHREVVYAITILGKEKLRINLIKVI